MPEIEWLYFRVFKFSRNAKDFTPFFAKFRENCESKKTHHIDLIRVNFLVKVCSTFCKTIYLNFEMNVCNYVFITKMFCFDIIFFLRVNHSFQQLDKAVSIHSDAIYFT